jgi:hypothetical protein
MMEMSEQLLTESPAAPYDDDQVELTDEQQLSDDMFDNLPATSKDVKISSLLHERLT